MPTAVQTSSDAFAWATRIIAVSLLAAVGTWVHQLGGVAAGAETAADGSISTDRMFNWHPVLMVLGFGVCMTEAVLAYRVPRGPNTQREDRKLVHWVLHTTAVLSISFALVAVWRSHDLKKPPIPNLYSPHSYLGLTVVILLGCQFLLGLYSYLWPKASLEFRVSLGPYHRFLGLAVYSCGLAAMATGLQEKATFLQLGGKKGVYSSYIRIPAMAELLLVALGLLVAMQFVFGGSKQQRQPVQYAPVIGSDHDDSGEAA